MAANFACGIRELPEVLWVKVCLNGDSHVLRPSFAFTGFHSIRGKPFFKRGTH